MLSDVAVHLLPPHWIDHVKWPPCPRLLDYKRFVNPDKPSQHKENWFHECTCNTFLLEKNAFMTASIPYGALSSNCRRVKKPFWLEWLNETFFSHCNIIDVDHNFWLIIWSHLRLNMLMIWSLQVQSIHWCRTVAEILASNSAGTPLEATMSILRHLVGPTSLQQNAPLLMHLESSYV
jgi:hypothetical protein